MPSLTELPAELFLHIVSFLKHDDVTQLIRVNRRLHNLVEPLLWTHIELHPPRWHRLYHIKQPPPEIDPEKRPYHHHRLPEEEREHLWRLNSRWAHKSFYFFMLLDRLYKTDKSRLKGLCSQIRTFCSPIDPLEWSDDLIEDPSGQPDPFTWDQVGYIKAIPNLWNVFPYFNSLERLELATYGRQPRSFDPFIEEMSPLTKLRSVKLMGYVPAYFARYILRSDSSLGRLTFGLLDNPIGSDFTDRPPCNPAPGWSKRNEPQEEDKDDEEEPRWYTEADESESDEDLDGESVAPRPLIWLPESLPPLRNLKYLHLLAPSQVVESNHGWDDITWSKRAEQACQKEWDRFICATQASVENLVIERRPAISYNDSYTSNLEFMIQNMSPSDLPLMMNMDALFRDQHFPSLKTVDFYGIPPNAPTTDLCNVKVRKSLTDTLREKNIAPEYHLGVRCRYNDEFGEIDENGDGMGADPYEDDEFDKW